MQESGFGQYLVLTGWNIQRDIPDGNSFSIFFDTVNPTKVPLRLDSMVFRFREQEYKEGYLSLLVPNMPRTLSASVKFDVPLLLYWDGNAPTAITVDCAIFFTDGIGRQWEQRFERIIGIVNGGPFEVQEVRTSLRNSTEAKKRWWQRMI